MDKEFKVLDIHWHLDCCVKECPFNAKGLYCLNSVLPYENPCWDSEPLFEDDSEEKIIDWIPHVSSEEPPF